MRPGEAVRVRPYGGTRAYEGFCGVVEEVLDEKGRARVRLYLPGTVRMDLPQRHLDRGRRLWRPTSEQLLAYHQAEPQAPDGGQRLLTLDAARAGVWPVLVVALSHQEAQAWARGERLPNEGWRRVGGPRCLHGWDGPTVVFCGRWRERPDLAAIQEAVELDHARAWTVTP